MYKSISTHALCFRTLLHRIKSPFYRGSFKAGCAIINLYSIILPAFLKCR